MTEVRAPQGHATLVRRAGRRAPARPRPVDERAFYPPPYGDFSKAMARGDVRIAATLACEECKRRNYQTNKSKRNNPERLQLRKYCKWCKAHTPHRETR